MTESGDQLEVQHALDETLAGMMNALQSFKEHDEALGTTCVTDNVEEFDEALQSLIGSKLKLTQAKQAHDEAMTQVNICYSYLQICLLIDCPSLLTGFDSRV